MNTSAANKLLEEVEEKARRGEPVALARGLHKAANHTTTAVVYEDRLFPPVFDHRLTERIVAEVEGMIAKGTSAELIETTDEEGSDVTLAIELIKPNLKLLVFGGGHVGQAVALMAALIGYDVTVIDDREQFASRERLPDPRIELVVTNFSAATRELVITSHTAIVIVTRGHQYDELCLKNVIDSRAGYIGMIGSRKRVLSVFRKLASEGFAESSLQRVHAPIGLSIGARSPQEIAVAILAEIIQYVNNPTQHAKGE